ncbi:MAG: PDR/VanB family oxidoreductase [Henriciella sp.]|nr:PDR/VanB family oxidoreductase [Henriciella sp.]
MSDLVEATVTEKREIARDIFSFTFLANKENLDRGQAGAHIDVQLPSGLLRQYSLHRISEIPGEYRVAVLREADGRGGSLELCDQVSVGDQITISPPRNNFPLEADKSHYILVAGGIGITPIRAMADALLDQNASFELHYCAQTPEKSAFLDELTSGRLGEHTQVHFSKTPDGERLNLNDLLKTAREGAQIYACGPQNLMDGLDAATGHWPSGAVRKEYFEAQEIALSADNSGAFSVRLQKSNTELVVPEDKTLLGVLAENGVDVPSSCQEGTCGTCLTEVVEGDLIHLDSCLYDDEKEAGDMIACCVSRAKPGSVLVLNL